jgi:hypothetical protein
VLDVLSCGRSACSTTLGAATFCMVAPIVAITRPTDMGGPFRALVINPARYTWGDPLGTH